MSALNDTLKDLQARTENARAELKAAAEKLEKAARGAATRVEENSKKLFDELVKTGEKLVKQQDKSAKKADKKAAEGSRLEQLTNRGAALLGLPTREDVVALEKKLAAVQRKLTKLEKGSAA
jgi:polyhydroxyalkanoate synthesis regulator phasin